MILQPWSSEEWTQAVNVIHLHVQTHLQPYFSGSITEKTQDKNRKPLIHTLAHTIQKTFQRSINELQIEYIACSQYIQLAVKDCEKKLGRAINPSDPKDVPQYAIFEEAIMQALEIDFTSTYRSFKILSMDILNAF